jgi:FKBP-type peptidyl-prolyl cis-trans isomerase FkpA
MKKVYYSLMIVAVAALVVSCGNVSYKKTKSGMLYKIISSNPKDSVVREGDWLKLYFVQRLNDSVLQSNYGKAPVYQKISNTAGVNYNPVEIFNLLRKGDSATTILLVDSVLKKGLMQELPPFMKKGDRLVLGLRVVDVFRSDSLYQRDYEVEMAKDAPRQQKEQEEQMAQMKKEMKAQHEKEELEMEKSGEAAKGIKDMQSFLASKNIKAQQVGKGTFVVIKQQGTGPQAAPGKFVTVKYNGKFLASDSTFEANVFTRQLDRGELISGMEEGLIEFKQGGVGTLYVPGFRAYGKNPNPGSPFKPFEPLKFDVEILNVSDTMPAQAAPPPSR